MLGSMTNFTLSFSPYTSDNTELYYVFFLLFSLNYLEGHLIYFLSFYKSALQSRVNYNKCLSTFFSRHTLQCTHTCVFSHFNSFQRKWRGPRVSLGVLSVRLFTGFCITWKKKQKTKVEKKNYTIQPSLAQVH